MFPFNDHICNLDVFPIDQGQMWISMNNALKHPKYSAYMANFYKEGSGHDYRGGHGFYRRFRSLFNNFMACHLNRYKICITIYLQHCKHLKHLEC